MKIAAFPMDFLRRYGKIFSPMRTVRAPATTDLDRAFLGLDSSETMVMKLRAGLIDGRRHTLREIGAFLGASRSEARSLEWQSWQKLEQLAREDEDSRQAITYLLKRCSGTNRSQKRILS
jgi:DNA-directed RNA polymerase sigma subunit (sigma70/sigma32)